MKQNQEISVNVIEETKVPYTGGMDKLEQDFNSFISKMEAANERVSSNINMDELDEISNTIIEARTFLSSFASGEKKTVREKAYNQLSALPLLGSWAKNKAEEIKTQELEDSSVKDVLKGIFNSFEVKKRRLIELTSMMTGMRDNLMDQESELKNYISKLDDIIENPPSVTDKMRALEMSVMAQAQEKITKEMIYNNIQIIIELMEGLHLKISKTLPVIKNSLNNSLNIVGTINSIRDAVEMMNALEGLSNEIIRKSSQSIDGLIIDATKSLGEGTDIAFFEESAKRNEEFQLTFLEARKEHIRKTVADHEKLKEISINAANQLEYRRKEEALALGIASNLTTPPEAE